MTGPRLVEAVCACGARLPGVSERALRDGTVVHLSCKKRPRGKYAPVTPAS